MFLVHSCDTLVLEPLLCESRARITLIFSCTYLFFFEQLLRPHKEHTAHVCAHVGIAHWKLTTFSCNRRDEWCNNYKIFRTTDVI